MNNEWLSLVPVNFFQHSIDCHEIEIEEITKLERRLATPRYRLPNLAPLCGEEDFAEVFLGWNVLGIAIAVASKEPFRRSSFPDVSRGDSLEVMFDTRDVKTSGYNTRFCHHFFCFPEPLEGKQAGELTHFRSEEDAHPYCDSSALQVKSLCQKKSYTMILWIPASCLIGYDPANFNRLGFTYRINRAGGPAQHFSAISSEFQIEQQPSLWSSLNLVKNTTL